MQDAMPGSFPNSDSSASSASTATTVIPPPSRFIPSPDSDNGPRWNSSHLPAGSSSLSPHMDDAPESPTQTQTTIRVRDLAHIQSLARADLLPGPGAGTINDPTLQQMKYEISGMPIGDIIEMVAALLTKITTTNDLQHDAPNRNAHHLRQAQAQAKGEEGSGDSSMSPLSSSVLAFHGKNVPAITILSYLSRIHKYCPTTYEVFLSLLVYFDRMTERVNDMVTKSEEIRRVPLERQQHAQPPHPTTALDPGSADKDTVMRDRDDDEEDSSDTTETDSELADSTDGDEASDGAHTGTERKLVGSAAAAAAAVANSTGPNAQATYFVVDSFNIHRLIIAGVTCASKFFSDVFYTNSRYAKVRFSLILYQITMLTRSQKGRRPSPPGTESPGTAVPPAQRLPPGRTRRGPRGVCHHAGRVLCARGGRAKGEGCAGLICLPVDTSSFMLLGGPPCLRGLVGWSECEYCVAGLGGARFWCWKMDAGFLCGGAGR